MAQATKTLQERLRSVSEDYRAKQGLPPNLQVFIKLLAKNVREYFSMDFEPSPSSTASVYSKNSDVKTCKTENSQEVESTGEACVMLPNSKHALAECKDFEKCNQFDKMKTLRENKLCFLCTGTHLRADRSSSPSCASQTLESRDDYGEAKGELEHSY